MNKEGLTRGQWFALTAAFLGWMFDGIEMGLFPLIARPGLTDLLKITDDEQIAFWTSVVIACFLLGAAGGGFLFGWLGDKIGRVRTMVLSVLTYSLFMGLGCFATQAWHLGLCLFLSALGMGGQWSLGVALVMECWPERLRPRLAGAIGAAANFGFLFIALVALIHPVTPDHWRWLMAVGASPAVLALFIALLVPESERWKTAAKKGGRSPVVEIFSPGLRGKTLLAMAFSAIPLIATWAAVSGYVPMWADQLQTAQVARPMLSPAEQAQLDAVKSPKEQTQVLVASFRDRPEEWRSVQAKAAPAKAQAQVALGIGAIIGCNLASLLGGYLGRRPAYFGLCVLSLLVCGYMFWFITVFDVWFIIMSAVVCGVTAGFYGLLPLYLPELFPTRVRATGQGLAFNCGRVLAAGGTLCMGQFVAMFDHNYGRAMGTITLVYVLGMVLIWFAPETKGKPLPE
jgi:MFS transporter, SHS family, sialic acid transporter